MSGGASDEQRAPRRPDSPALGEIVRGVAADLAAAGIADARLEAERLVAHAAGMPRSEVATSPNRRLAAAEAATLVRGVSRRLRREPLQHIEGEAAFRRLTLVSDGRALIPRPETEQLVDRIAAWAAGLRLEAVLDIGTGSGAIALALLEEGIASRVIGLDVSPAALEQARENRERLGIDPARFELRLAGQDFWSEVGREERFALIVSNPPYVPETELDGLQPEVRDFEPRSALAAGADGLDVIRRIAAGAAAHLEPGAPLFVEIGARQAHAADLFLETDGWIETTVQRDLAGRDRFLFAVSAALAP